MPKLPDKNKNYQTLKKFCQKSGADFFGVADIRPIKETIVLSKKLISSLDYAISLGVKLSRGVLEDVEDKPTRLYFHHYRTVNVCLDQLALGVARFIEDKGFRAVPIAASQILDWQKQSAHLSHKRLAILSGLGWLGRNNLLVTAKAGSQLRLVTILTDMPFKLDKEQSFGCGDCRLCINACPAEAIKDAPENFDHQACFLKLKEFQREKLVDQYICGVCVQVCKGKPNIRAQA